LYKCSLDELEHGDSMHLPAAQDLLTIFRWAFAGLRGFEPMPQQTHIKPGLVDRQTTLAGGGSCGIVSTNFIEIRVGLDTPRWSSKQSAQFRDVILQEVLLFHLLARRKMTTYSDWVTPCARLANGEAPSFIPDIGIGYNDFNL
ncbi:hypothetical protein B0H10DRAFT_1731124, partial [Mycena sp. CBHHK59/15]